MVDYEKLTIFRQGQIVSSLNLYVLNNDDEAHDGRPFAVIENVRTDERFQNQGYAQQLLREAINKARASGCYKVMLATSSTKANVDHLYRKMGFSDSVKRCFYLNLESDG